MTITATLGVVSKQAQVTLTPQIAPDSLTLDPTSVTGTSGSSGTVRIAAPATTTTQFVLTSSNPNAASVPSSVQIPQGSTAGGFFISTTAVSAPTVVTISVTGAGVTKTATLTVNPFGGGTGGALASLTLNPTSVRGGKTSTATVTLSAAAPSGGAVVSLSSGNTGLATVPTSITIPAGATSASFTVSTKSVNSDATVTISASYVGATTSATLTVTRR